MLKFLKVRPPFFPFRRYFSMDMRSLYEALETAWERKRSLLKHTGALRLLNAQASGTPRLVFELYGEYGILYDYGTGLGESLKTAAFEWRKTFGWDSISWVDRTVPGDEGRAGHFVLVGDPPKEIVIREGSLRFRIEPCHPRNVGLFLDTRELRTWLCKDAGAKRVLNLFSYTGSLGLAALFGGAEEVVNVDVSQRYLEWGRGNVRLNGLPEEKCRFIRMDSERYLDWAAKKNLKFDHIVLDPPVFSRFDGKVFRFQDDYFRLAAKAAVLLSSGGSLHAVTNYSGISALEFEQGLERAFEAVKRPVRNRRAIPLPPDFDVGSDSANRSEGNALIFQMEL